MFAEFINQYGMQILYTLLTAFFGYIGILVKNLVKKHLDDKTKQDVAKTVVKYIEQVYKDIHGEDKLNKALASASAMLAEKGITVTELEMRVLIEAAVAEFNNAFNKSDEIAEKGDEE